MKNLRHVGLVLIAVTSLIVLTAYSTGKNENNSKKKIVRPYFSNQGMGGQSPEDNSIINISNKIQDDLKKHPEWTLIHLAHSGSVDAGDTRAYWVSAIAVYEEEQK